jgi:hypothetical protein
MFSMTINRGCHNAATDEKSMSAGENFLFGDILNKGNSFSLSEPFNRMGVVRNDSQKPIKKDGKRAVIQLWKTQVPLSNIRTQLKRSESTLRRIQALPSPISLTPSTPSPTCPTGMRDDQILVLIYILCHSTKIYTF